MTWVNAYIIYDMNIQGDTMGIAIRAYNLYAHDHGYVYGDGMSVLVYHFFFGPIVH